MTKVLFWAFYFNLLSMTLVGMNVNLLLNFNFWFNFSRVPEAA